MDHCRPRTYMHEMRTSPPPQRVKKFQNTSTNKQSRVFRSRMNHNGAYLLFISHYRCPRMNHTCWVGSAVGRDGHFFFSGGMEWNGNSPSQSPAETGLAKPARAAAVAATRAVVFIVVSFVVSWLYPSLAQVGAFVLWLVGCGSTFQVE